MSHSLKDVLTVHHLRALAGPAFARGEAYWLDGHVVSCVVSGEALEGVVLGSEPYHVALSASGGFLNASCTCPVGSPMCKHAVALGLAYLDEALSSGPQVTVPLSARELRSGNGAMAASGASGASAGGGLAEASGFATRKELDAWAAEHEVAHALWQSAEGLVERLRLEDVQRYGLRHLLGRLALRDMCSRDSVRRLIGVRALEGPITEAAYRVLEEAAAVVQVGRDEERSRPARLELWKGPQASAGPDALEGRERQEREGRPKETDRPKEMDRSKAMDRSTAMGRPQQRRTKGRSAETTERSGRSAVPSEPSEPERMEGGDALRQESAKPQRAYDDSRLVALWSRLIEARRVVRAHGAPRSRAWRAANGTWKFEGAAATVVWTERARAVRGPYEHGTVGVATRLTTPNGGAPQLECTCGAREGRCAHGVALIDATLDVLEDAGRRDEGRAMAEELLRPGWARLLQELDRLEARVAKPRAAIEVWWRIEQEMGMLVLSPIVKKQLRGGGMSSGSKPTVARMLEEHRDQLSAVDRQIAEDVMAWAPGRGSWTPSRPGRYPVRAFAALVGHPRVIAEWSEEPIEVVRVPLGFAARPVGEEVCLEVSLDGAPFNRALLDGLMELFAAGEPVVIEEREKRRCLLVDVSDEARRLLGLLGKHGDVFPPESHAQLVERLSRMEGRVPLVVPPVLKGKQLACEAITVARLRLLPDVTLELELGVRPGPGAPMFAPGAGPRDVLLMQGGERGYVRRALTDEPGRARGMLEGLPLEGAEEGPPFCYRIEDGDRALALVSALQAPRSGLEVEWLDAKPTIARGVGAEGLRVQVERRRDWFGLVGDLKVEAGRLELAVLLDAARRQQRFVRIDEGRWLELSDVLRQRLQAVADQTFAGRHELELSPGAVPAIRALEEAGAKVETAPDWRVLAERLASSVAMVPRPPAQLQATLRDYQVEGHAWLSRVAAWGAGACLADDMGLGKTVQAIAVLLDRARQGPALVLAPTSVAINWAEELRRFAPTLSPVLYGEQVDRARALAKLRKKDVVIASYGLLVRDVEALARTRFATLVIDEAQALKNANTRRARAARRLDAAFRIALSGTPLENHLGELWSLYAIVFPGLLGSWEQFRERFATPIERGKDPEARAALSRVLRPFLLRRTKQEVARELPSRTEIEVPVVLSKEERELYEDARLAAIVELERQGKGMRDERRRFQILAALTRLRLLASHPRLYDGRSEVESSKLRRLLELLDELRSEGHRALVFSQFTSHLALVAGELDRAGYTSLYLDGGTPAAERARRIARFQAGEADVFLLSLKAGGTGVNLTAADYVIHLDPWWNPAVEDQATDRAHRIGQTRPVTVYRLIARGTIEEQILGMHRDKRALVASVLDGTDVAARLTTKDLLALLAASQAPASADDDEREAPHASA